MLQPALGPPLTRAIADQRQAFIRQFGAGTLDVAYIAGRCRACGKEPSASHPASAIISLVGAPYSSYDELTGYLRSILSDRLDANASTGRCEYCQAMAVAPEGMAFAYVSAKSADLIVCNPGGCWTAFWFDGHKLYPVGSDEQISSEHIRMDALVRAVVGAYEATEGDEVDRAVDEALAGALSSMDLTTAATSIARRRPDLTEKILSRQLAAFPEAASLHHTLGAFLRDTKGPRPADASLERAMLLAPENLNYGFEWAMLPRFGGDLDEALRRLHVLRERFGEAAQLHYNLGAVHHARGEDAQAAEHYARGGELDPNDADYPYCEARSWLALGKAHEASRALERGRRLDPSHRLLPVVEVRYAEATGGDRAGIILRHRQPLHQGMAGALLATVPEGWDFVRARVSLAKHGGNFHVGFEPRDRNGGVVELSPPNPRPFVDFARFCDSIGDTIVGVYVELSREDGWRFVVEPEYAKPHREP